jgi:hypothetical protein
MTDHTETRSISTDCNRPLGSNDLQSIASKLPGARGFRMYRGLRGTIVVLRKKTGAEIAGALAVVLGFAGIAWQTVFVQFNPAAIGVAALVIGVLLVCYSKLSAKNMASDEIFQTGVDRGYEMRDEELRRDGHPHVVDITTRLCSSCQENRVTPAVQAVR